MYKTNTNLDKYIKGFKENDIILIAGETGCGKTIMTLTILHSLSSQNHKSVYISVDEPASRVFEGAKNLGFDFYSLQKQGLFYVFDWRPSWKKIYERNLTVNPIELATQLIDILKKCGAKVLALDPIAPAIFHQGSLLFVREYLRILLWKLMEENIFTIITSEIPTGSNLLSRFGVEEFLATGIISLYRTIRKGKVYRYMDIRKLRWRETPDKLISFKIGKGGIIVE